MPEPDPVSREIPRRPRRELLAATVGSVIEIYDWTIYAVLAPYFATALYPGGTNAALLAAYGTFAAGFVVRPISAAVLCRFADVKGRRWALTFSVGVMACASLLIAVVPSATQIGIAAAVLVALARLIQGISMGGEMAAAAVYVAETAPPRRRFLFSSIAFSGTIIGNVMALVLTTVLLQVFGKDGVAGGGWRIAFGFGAVLGLVALWIRRSVAETDEFTETVASTDEATPVLEVLRSYRRPLLLAVFIAGGATAMQYFSSVYLPTYAAALGVISAEAATGQLLLAFPVMIATMLLAGAAADRWGSLPTIRIATLVVAITPAPLVLAMVAGVLPFAVVAMLYGAVVGAVVGLVPVFLAQFFPVRVRALGAGVPYALGAALFGGTFPLIGAALVGASQPLAVPWVAAALGALAFVCTILLRTGDVRLTSTSTGRSATADVE